MYMRPGRAQAGMRAIILAAGRGARLEAFNHDGRPKCLLEFGGRSLLDRQLRLLAENGVACVDIVVGYAAEHIRRHVATLADKPDTRFIHNPHFEQGSVLSLHAARDGMTAGGDVLLMDADVLFHPGILQKLCTSAHRNAYLVDRAFTPGEEPVKIAIRGQRMVEFRKALPAELEYDVLGESVGFFRFDGSCAGRIAARCEDYETDGLGDMPHEEALRDILLRHPDWFGFEDVTGLPWIELDFAEDTKRAETEILPAIRRDFPGF
jgi:choline kinase